MPRLFDSELRALRRDRAFRLGAETFLHERAFDEVLARLGDIGRSFDRALLLGCPVPDWSGRLTRHAKNVQVLDPGPCFAEQAQGRVGDAAALDVEPGSFDLIVAMETLATSEPIDEATARLRFALAGGGLLIGALVGGDSLPQLRAAMAVSDRLSGQARAHVHPRIAPSSLAHLLMSAGFEEPVVDVDRVDLRYADLGNLVGDLRRMGATNILEERSRQSLTRNEWNIAKKAFRDAANEDGKTSEAFQILHFSAWSPSSEPMAG